MNEKFDSKSPLIIAGNVGEAITIIHRYLQEWNLQLNRPVTWSLRLLIDDEIELGKVEENRKNLQSHQQIWKIEFDEDKKFVPLHRPVEQSQHLIAQLNLEPMSAQSGQQRYKLVATFKLFNDRIRDEGWLAVLILSPLPGKCRMDLVIRETLLKPRLDELWIHLYERMREDTVLVSTKEVTPLRGPEGHTTLPNKYDNDVRRINSQRDRDMVQMWRDGYTGYAIGRLLGLASGTVYNCLHKLRKMYSEEVVPYKKRRS